MTKKDHDLLIEINTHVKYIKKAIVSGKKERTFLKSENQKRKDWQETHETKLKTVAGVATFVGGIVVFVFNFVTDLISKKG